MTVTKNIKLTGAIILSLVATIALAASATAIVMAQTNNDSLQACNIDDVDELTFGDWRNFTVSDILCITVNDAGLAETVPEVRTSLENQVNEGTITQDQADAINEWLDSTPGFILTPSILLERYYELIDDEQVPADFGDLFFGGLSPAIIKNLEIAESLIPSPTDTVTFVRPDNPDEVIGYDDDDVPIFDAGEIYILPEGVHLPENHADLGIEELRNILKESVLEHFSSNGFVPDGISTVDEFDEFIESELPGPISALKSLVDFAHATNLLTDEQHQAATDWIDSRPDNVDEVLRNVFEAEFVGTTLND